MTQEYLRPKSIEEAISLHHSLGEKARFIAGGTDLMVKMKEKQVRPQYLISLKSIPGLDQIEYEEEELKIGALVTHRQLELSPVIRKHFPILTDAVENIGSVQIRNVATLGGNIATAVPSADGATPLIALGAKVRLVGPRGERTIGLENFFTGVRQTVLEQGEILSHFIIPDSYRGQVERTGNTPGDRPWNCPFWEFPFWSLWLRTWKPAWRRESDWG